MLLYSYFRSSAAYRVRIALNLKGLDYATRGVHLLRGGGEQHSAEYRRLNPLGRVPTLVDGPAVLSQSLAILEYLDETHPTPPLLPRSAADRAYARSLALIIACDIQPLQNTSTTQYLTDRLGIDKDGIKAWYKHWIENGLGAVEKLLAASARNDKFCVGPYPTIADACLVPQCASARRFHVDLSAMPRILGIETECRALDAFKRAAPEAQPDYEP
jgi:maleylpyruvate isomerase